jgi:hypothetical protein
MPAAQVAAADYRPDWWPADTRLLIRRVRLDVAAGQVSTDPRSRRRRTLHPDQRALPLTDLADAEGVYSYSFIMTNLDVSTPDTAAAVEHWYRHRASIQTVFRDSKHGAALRHLPSGHRQVNLAWMWGALLAATIAGWLHHLTATTRPDGTLAGHGSRHRQSHDRHPAPAPGPRPRPPGPPRPRTHPTATTRPQPPRRGPRPPARTPDTQLTTGPTAPTPPEPANPARPPGPPARPDTRNTTRKINNTSRRSARPVTRGFGSEHGR